MHHTRNRRATLPRRVGCSSLQSKGNHVSHNTPGEQKFINAVSAVIMIGLLIVAATIVLALAFRIFKFVAGF
jgi:hypothetical protein